MKFALALAALLAASCSKPPSGIDSAKLVDLSYTFDETTVYWPNAEGFRHRKDTWTKTAAGFWYAAGEFTSAEHGGTHIDSPVHFSEGKLTLDKIPVSRLVAPALVIDVNAADRDYRVSPDDITKWEQAHVPIAANSIVVFRTGWGKFWPDRKQYLGSDVKGDIANLHFPGLSKEAAELLVARKVTGVGIDTASLDYGPSTDFIAHQVLNGANIYGIENIAEADKLPATGATLIVMPMKIGEGSGGPARVVALLQ
ncbi:MAG: cyclase family protein [Bryobacteraceae bacterium]